VVTSTEIEIEREKESESESESEREHHHTLVIPSLSQMMVGDFSTLQSPSPPMSPTYSRRYYVPTVSPFRYAGAFSGPPSPLPAGIMSPSLIYSPCVGDFLSLSPGFLSSSPENLSNFLYPNVSVAASRKLLFDTVVELEEIVATVALKKDIAAVLASEKEIVATEAPEKEIAAMAAPEKKISAPDEEITAMAAVVIASEKEIAAMAAPSAAVFAPEEETIVMAAPAAAVVEPGEEIMELVATVAASAVVVAPEMEIIEMATSEASVAATKEEITEMAATEAAVVAPEEDIAAPEASATAAALEEDIAAPEEDIAAMAATAAAVAALEEEIAAPEEEIAAPEEEITAPEEEIAAVVDAVPHANIADTVYENGCFMFKNVGAINDIDNLSTADKLKLKCAIAKTQTNVFKRSKKRSRTTIDLETSGIHGVRVHNQQEQFLVHWTDDDFKSWEPTKNVFNLIGVMNYLSNTKKNATIYIE
jgi:hypothetical protein